MDRKCNLFYTSGPDSKFLTFSNYTEALTGNFLSTDTKIYPSMFLCLLIPDLTDDELKAEFIKDYLVAYYENKLACLRAYCKANDLKQEDHVMTLAYLLEALSMYADDHNLSLNDMIVHIGDISEQDYNGTYTDTICEVNFNQHWTGNIVSDSSNEPIAKTLVEASPEELVGWPKHQMMISGYEETKPKFTSESSTYSIETDIEKIQLIKPIERPETLKFNIVIPLFDVQTINYHTAQYIEDEISSMDSAIIANASPCLRSQPLGIWFSDDVVSLHADLNTGFCPSWSLVISSQFKPFPYSHKMTSQVDDQTVSNAYPTFAMVLSKQNALMHEYMKLTGVIADQQRQITQLQEMLKQSANEANIDRLKREFLQFEHEQTKRYNQLEEKIKEFMSNLEWNAVQ